MPGNTIPDCSISNRLHYSGDAFQTQTPSWERILEREMVLRTKPFHRNTTWVLRQKALTVNNTGIYSGVCPTSICFHFYWNSNLRFLTFLPYCILSSVLKDNGKLSTWQKLLPHQSHWQPFQCLSQISSKIALKWRVFRTSSLVGEFSS